ncbi:hypothetical protein FKM82_018714 [Ascaphus truei]
MSLSPAPHVSFTPPHVSLLNPFPCLYFTPSLCLSFTLLPSPCLFHPPPLTMSLLQPPPLAMTLTPPPSFHMS